MYSILQHSHSGLRWIFLICLIWAIYNAYDKWQKTENLNLSTRMPAFLAFNLAHLQALLGLILYFISPRIVMGEAMMKDKMVRFFAMEHPLMMLIAITLITVGYMKAKKNTKGTAFKNIFWYYLIALAIILIMIPWPFQNYGTKWF